MGDLIQIPDLGMDRRTRRSDPHILILIYTTADREQLQRGDKYRLSWRERLVCSPSSSGFITVEALRLTDVDYGKTAARDLV